MAVQPVTFHLSRMQAPRPLQGLTAWLTWRLEADPDGGKDRKVPYYVDGGRRWGQPGSDRDRARLTTFSAAKARAMSANHQGVGLAILPGQHIIALDIDNCVGREDALIDDIKRTTYCEYSPSGKGLRAFVRGDARSRKSLANADQYGMEVFGDSGFVTVTGNQVEECELFGLTDTVAPIWPSLQSALHQRFGAIGDPRGPLDDDIPDPPIGLSLTDARAMLDAIGNTDLPYEASKGPSWLGIGMALHHEFAGSDDAFDLWDDWSSWSSKHASSEYGRRRWDSFRRSGITAASLKRWALDAGWAESVEIPETLTEPEPDQTLKYQVEALGDFVNGPLPKWLIKQVLPEADVAMIYGRPGCGKSFVAFDMAMCVARGQAWRGHRTRAGRVVYVAAEGAGGMRLRGRAYRKEFNVGQVPFGVLHGAPNMLDKADAAELIKGLRAFGDVDLVVIDTLAQTMPGGNENSSEDMSRVIAHCKAIHKHTNATVLLVHHTGKDAEKGPRGWSGLIGGAECYLEVIREHGADIGEIRVRKMKDGDDTGRWGFGLRSVPLGMDADGDPLTSCVVIEEDIPEPTKKVRMGAIERVVFEACQGVEFGPVSVGKVIELAVEMLPEPTGQGRDRRHEKAARAVEALVEKGTILQKNDEIIERVNV